jgi:hypothetical protein
VGAGVIGGVITLGFLFLPGMRKLERTPAQAETTEQSIGLVLDAPAA